MSVLTAASPYSSGPIGVNTLAPCILLHRGAQNLGLSGPGKILNLAMQRPSIPRAEHQWVGVGHCWPLLRQCPTSSPDFGLQCSCQDAHDCLTVHPSSNQANAPSTYFTHGIRSGVAVSAWIHRCLQRQSIGPPEVHKPHLLPHSFPFWQRV